MRADRWHVLPQDDIRVHDENEECWCNPETQYIGVGILVVHKSADGREEYEQGRKMH